jgi:hypothetical protein
LQFPWQNVSFEDFKEVVNVFPVEHLNPTMAAPKRPRKKRVKRIPN